MNKPQPQTGPEIEEYSTTATPKAYAGSVPVFCAHDAIVPLKDLRPNPKNPNQHPPEQIKLLASIIRATGWRAPITVSKRSGLVTKGHGRLMAAQLDDLTDAPVDYQDYASEAEELADLTADNRIAELATTDNKMLAEVFADIDTGEIPFMLSGYTNDAYEAILDYMIGEAQKVGLKAKQLTEITGVQMWGHWFSKSQFTPIPEWHYKKLQQAFKGRAFSLPHDQVMKLRNKPSEAYQSMKAEAMELRAFFDNTHNDSDEHDIMTDVWRFPITNTAERDDAGGHATPKPIALCERAILSSSRPGELVVDFFGGSGSTLIACENTGRTCAMIELEPKWCDVIVRRYIKTTGDNNVRCVRQGRELPREEIAAIFEPDEEGGEQE